MDNPFVYYRNINLCTNGFQASDAGIDKPLRHPDSFLELPIGWIYGQAAREQAEIQIKYEYEGYLQKEIAQNRQTRAMEEETIPADTDYHANDAPRMEAREKLQARWPLSRGLASRIPGVNPADIAVLMVWLKRRKEQEAKEETNHGE